MKLLNCKLVSVFVEPPEVPTLISSHHTEVKELELALTLLLQIILSSSTSSDKLCGHQRPKLCRDMFLGNSSSAVFLFLLPFLPPFSSCSYFHQSSRRIVCACSSSTICASQPTFFTLDWFRSFDSEVIVTCRCQVVIHYKEMFPPLISSALWFPMEIFIARSWE